MAESAAPSTEAASGLTATATAPLPIDPLAGLPVLQRIALIGTGLIGGSLALALRAHRPGLAIRAFDRDATHGAQALALGIATEVCDSPAAAVEGAQLVVLAAPVGALPALLAAIAPALDPAVVLTDVGSTKTDVVAAARASLGEAFARFVPGHPISGAERSGPVAADATLFRGRRVVLTPLADTAADALAAVAGLWRVAGAEVHCLSPEHHDRVFAAVSHLPHLLSFTLVDELSRRPDAGLLFAYAAGGFRDFTRIAASHPDMWRDIALANRAALLDELDAYLAAVAAVRAQLAAEDGEGLHRLFERARKARRQLS